MTTLDTGNPRRIDLGSRGARGESFADILRRTGLYGVLLTDTDGEALAKLTAAADAAADAAEAAAIAAAISAMSLGPIVGEILVAATSNLTLSGEQTIDGQLTNSSNVLLTGQTDASENGLYTTDPGSWVRYQSAKHDEGLLVTVLYGVGAGQWKLTTTGVIVLDTTNLEFVNVQSNDASRINSSVGALSSVISNRGVVHLRESGAVGDGAVDDRTPVIAARDEVLALSTNPVWSTKAVLTDDGRMTTYLPGGVSLFGLGQIAIKGTLKMASASDFVEIGQPSILGEPNRFEIAKVQTGYVRATGIMNGMAKIGNVNKLELFADSGTTDRRSVAYSKFEVGGLCAVVLNGVDTDGVGGVAPYINSNIIDTLRISSYTTTVGYPHNMIFVDCMGSDSITINMAEGYSTFFNRGRWEGASTATFAAPCHNNIMENAYYPFADSYGRRHRKDIMTVADSGKVNYFVEKLDAYYDHKELWAVHPDSKNYDVSKFNRNPLNVSLPSSYQVIFDSGMIPVDNSFWLFLDAIASTSMLFQPFLYLFDSAKALITTDPGSSFTTIINGTWQTTGDPLGLGHHYRTTAPVTNVTLPCHKHATVKYVRLVIRTGVVTSQTITRFRVVLTELKRFNTRPGLLTPPTKENYYSPNGTTATSVPCTAGTFNADEYVVNTNQVLIGSAPDQFRIKGWHRVTTGTGHVNITDWLQDRTYLEH